MALSGSYDEDEVFECVRAGASGYLLKDAFLAPAGRLGTRCSAASRPCVVVGRLIEEVIDIGGARAGPDLAQDGLTPRQRRVLQLMREGLTTAQIARRIARSEVTVRRHISEVVRRTGAVNREALRQHDNGDAP